MKQKTHLIVLVTLFIQITNVTNGQVGITSTKVLEQNGQKKEKPQIGKPMPDFTLDNITNYTTNKASLNDFKGKWLVLDYWFSGCVSCIKGFPKINNLHNKFKDKVQFIIVGDNEKSEGGNKIINVYERLRKLHNLDLASAYDSVMIQNFNIFSFPYILIIDPNGVVKAITDGRDLTEDKISQLLDGGSPSFYPKDRVDFSIGINNMKPEPSDSNILFQSVLTKYNNENYLLPYIEYQLRPQFKRKGFKVAGIALPLFYNLAYFGKHYWTRGDSLYNVVYRQPILEIKDSSLFIWSDNIIKGLYNYSLDVPPHQATKEGLMKRMQGDLYNYFGYKVRTEKRNVPVWLLVAKKNAYEKLKSTGKSINSTYDSGTGFNAFDISITELLNLISQYLGKEMNLTPFFDETGITRNIDIKIDALMSDINQVKRELNKYGLDIIKGERVMTILVISDETNR